MKQKIWILLSLFLLSASLQAEKVIYVHGMSLTESNEACQDKTVCPYWKVPPVGDYVYVGYDGRRNPFVSDSTAGSVRLLQMLNKYCRKDQGKSCRLIDDSLGGFTGAGTVSMYNKTGIYNILYATQIVSAEGGSEIANLGDTAIDILKVVFNIQGGLGDALIQSRDAIQSLVTTSARSLFDHNRNNGTLFYHLAAKKSIFIADPFLPGEDDSLVAFHSSCGYRTVGAFSKCMGEKIRSCALCFWETPKLITPWDGHYMHPLVPITGLDIPHAEGHNDVKYHGIP
ncbi:hypothetical protein [Leptospira sarikeiensis]|uniref:Alpha/beta hydrolase n=1 Tax=Leptospira sarikeiensis TaxID=2484943 RepID=A0A4R9K0B3_9LEPT|nr:hypothetical protein [Leptospira sarikeiensis]TGL58439.1 hypothetical protein EHQ64_19315 [Leptospira sarikeiensis]